MAKLNQLINASTSLFTLLAAIAAAVSAYFSYAQTDLARVNQLKTEQLAAFDRFTDQASSVCELFSNPSLDAVWDGKTDDFRPTFDLSPLLGQKIDDKVPAFAEYNEKRELITKRLNELGYLGFRLIRLESKGFDAHFVDNFIANLSNIEGKIDLTPSQKDRADYLRYLIKAIHRGEKECWLSVGDLMKGYAGILKID